VTELRFSDERLPPLSSSYIVVSDVLLCLDDLVAKMGCQLTSESMEWKTNE